MAELTWKLAAVTDRGLHRVENQDSFYISPDGRVLVVADGMGGARGGGIASKLAVEAVAALYEKSPPDETDRALIQQWLVDAISDANRTVFSVACDVPPECRMGTTLLVSVQSKDGMIHIAHVGDSRAYLIRGGKTVVLTQDHSVVMEMLLNGHLTPDQFRTSPFRHYLTRCVGHHSKVEIDRTPFELAEGDWIVLATDGLSAVLHDEEIGEVVCRCEDAEAACKELLEKTLDGGAPDNVTIVAVQYAPALNKAGTQSCSGTTR